MAPFTSVYNKPGTPAWDVLQRWQHWDDTAGPQPPYQMCYDFFNPEYLSSGEPAIFVDGSTDGTGYYGVAATTNTGHSASIKFYNICSMPAAFLSPRGLGQAPVAELLAISHAIALIGHERCDLNLHAFHKLEYVTIVVDRQENLTSYINLLGVLAMKHSTNFGNAANGRKKHRLNKIQLCTWRAWLHILDQLSHLSPWNFIVRIQVASSMGIKIKRHSWKLPDHIECPDILMRRDSAAHPHCVFFPRQCHPEDAYMSASDYEDYRAKLHMCKMGREDVWRQIRDHKIRPFRYWRATQQDQVTCIDFWLATAGSRCP